MKLHSSDSEDTIKESSDAIYKVNTTQDNDERLFISTVSPFISICLFIFPDIMLYILKVAFGLAIIDN